MADLDGVGQAKWVSHSVAVQSDLIARRLIAELKYVVCKLEELPEGMVRTAELRGRKICIINSGGEFFAMSSRCPHEGADLSYGRLGSLVKSTGAGHYERVRAGEVLRCPWHGWEFDVRTGQSWCRPRTVKTKAFDVVCANGEDLIRGEYVAETFRVETEGQYLIIDLA